MEIMLRKLYFISFLAAILMTGCNDESKKKESGIPEKMTRNHGDSIALAARFTGDFEHFLAVTDSLTDAGELSQIRADGYRGVAYFQLGQVEKSIECLRRAVADDPPAEDFWEYMHAGTNLVIILNSQRNYDLAMRTALRLIEHLKKVDNPQRAIEMQTLYLCLGDTQMMLERQEEAMTSYNEAYQWVLRTVNNPTCRPMAASFETLENIAVTHISHHLDEAGTWVDRMDSLLAVYQVQPNADAKEVNIFRALVYLHRAQVCQMRGQVAEAARFYAQYDSTDYGKGIEGRINGCDYLVEAHRYAEAADNYELLDRFVKEWGYEYDLETISKNLLPKLRSNYFAGRKDSALQVALQIAEVFDSALVGQKRSDAAELAVIYDTQGKERQIADQEAKNRLFAVINIAISIVALLIVGFAIFVFRLWRETKKKNRILAEQISEAVEYKEKYRQSQQALQTLSQPLPDVNTVLAAAGADGKATAAENGEEKAVEAAPVQEERAEAETAEREAVEPGTAAETTVNGKASEVSSEGGESSSSSLPPIIISDLTVLTDGQLFLCLRDLIENERLYLQPDFGRQTLIEHTGLSKERIGAAFAQGSDRNSLPAYVRELRLDYAIRLMNKTDITIEQVSQMSGFTSADTFTRNFRTKYGMTPTVYKQTKYGN